MKIKNLKLHRIGYAISIFAAVILILTAVLPLMQRGKTACAKESRIWDGTIAKKFAGGNGTAVNPYEISTGEELAYLAKLVNDGNVAYNADYVFYVLKNNIILNDTNDWENWSLSGPINKWTPIGMSDYNYPNKAFKANFDGQGFAVKGAYNAASGTDGDNLGLFGYAEGGKIMNVGVEQSYFEGHDYIGGIVGGLMHDGSAINCYFTGNISGRIWLGGIVGNAGTDGVVKNCYNMGNISGDTRFVGGVAGYIADTKMSNCYNMGNASGSEGKYVGGVVGYVHNNAEAVYCYNLMNTTPQAAGSGSTGTVRTAEFDVNGRITSSGIPGITAGTDLLIVLNMWVDNISVSNDCNNWASLMFNANGGSTVATMTLQILLVGQRVPAFAAPEKDDFIFNGWHMSNGINGGGWGDKWDFDEPIMGNTTLYARWGVFRVTFESNGGSLVESQVLDDGEILAEPDEPEKAGFMLGGWYTSNGISDGDWGDKWDFSNPVTDNITLYARWGLYMVTFESNGGSLVESQMLNNGEILAEPKEPEKNDFMFGGWYTSNGISGDDWGNKWDFNEPVTDSMILYAKWESGDSYYAQVIMEDFTYDGINKGNPYIDDDTKSGDWTVITYEYSNDGIDWSESAPIDAGIYYIRAVLTESSSGSCDDFTTEAVQYTINKADGTGSIYIEDWMYGEEANEPIISDVPSGYGEPVYEYKLKGADDSTYTTGIPIKKGEYTIRASFEANENYEAFSITYDFKIKGEGLSSCAIMWIIIGILLFIILVIILIVFKKKKSKNDKDSNSGKKKDSNSITVTIEIDK